MERIPDKLNKRKKLKEYIIIAIAIIVLVALTLLNVYMFPYAKY